MAPSRSPFWAAPDGGSRWASKRPSSWQYAAKTSRRRFESDRHRAARQVDGEYAAASRLIAHAQSPLISLDHPLGDGQAEPESGSVGGALRERQEHGVREPGGQTAAMVLDVDPDSIAISVGAQRHLGVRHGELERILQKIGHRRDQERAV